MRFYDPVFEHIIIVGLLLLRLERREREKENVRQRARRNKSVTEQKPEADEIVSRCSRMKVLNDEKMASET